MIFYVPAAAGAAISAARWLLAMRRVDDPAVHGRIALQWWWGAIACVALQLWLTLGAGMQLSSPLRLSLLWGSNVTLAAIVALNMSLRWMGLIAVGMLLNMLVMIANGGLMPISPETLIRGGNGHVLRRVEVGQPLPRSKDVILQADQTHLLALSDMLVIPGRKGSFSVGDTLIAAGLFLTLQGSIVSAGARPPVRLALSNFAA